MIQSKMPKSQTLETLTSKVIGVATHSWITFLIRKVAIPLLSQQFPYWEGGPTGFFCSVLLTRFESGKKD